MGKKYIVTSESSNSSQSFEVEIFNKLSDPIIKFSYLGVMYTMPREMFHIPSKIEDIVGLVEALNSKQKTLIQGANITISENGTISATGGSGAPLELRKTATYIQWRRVGDITWIDLVPLTDITGPPGDPNFLTFTAGETISGGKAVIMDTDGKVYVYNITNENHYGKYLGIAKTSGTNGNPIDVYTYGVATEVGSGWSAGIVYYISSTGILTSTPPTGATSKIAGVGVGTDKVLINDDVGIITL